MRKIHFFVLIELILVTLALLTMFTDDLTRGILFLVLCLLLYHYYRVDSQSNLLLVALSLFLFLAFSLNPFGMAAIIFGLIYGFTASIPYLYREHKPTVVTHLPQAGTKQRNTWIGDFSYFLAEDQDFEDLNLFRFSGNDTLYLDQVVIGPEANLILIRKVVGHTKIYVPIDLAVELSVNTLYGDVHFFDESYYLRNEQLQIHSEDLYQANRSVKLVISSLLGNVEVIRR
ncbi:MULTISPECIES: cell wall-active antibiotics response protein LiaF [unclassified Streptococcus]|uniref:cell wall-active antibiotics response protein LiaF n=1 Tax=unclassified Streptococcus TaxID=2608887 RepID=UPI0018AAA3A7|nr:MULTISPECIES: cell wall-active antibiotics response protein LiaF [unclassified Streptococcus]MBF8970058.1 transporter [Streptococcus sp. NLN76]MBG9367760.1 transporter [Streptococcus sp. NLN64]MBJ6745962.1 transporter [Streptococcus sp. 121]